MNHDQAVLVIGASGHGKSVISVLQAAGYQVRAVIDDDPAKWGQKVMGIQVAGRVQIGTGTFRRKGRFFVARRQRSLLRMTIPWNYCDST